MQSVGVDAGERVLANRSLFGLFIIRRTCSTLLAFFVQMRYDGKLGFPGGIVSDLDIPDDTLEEGLNREMKEEIGLDLTRFAFKKSHYVVSHFCPIANLILNFYAQEVSEADFKDIELAALKSEEYGHECLGVLRTPLYTMQDGQNGLPAFFKNQFAGTSLLQLVVGLLTQKIMSDSELQENCANVLPKQRAYKRLVDLAINSYSSRKSHSSRVAQIVDEFNKKSP